MITPVPLPDAAALDAAIARNAFSGAITVHADGKRVFERCEGFAHRAHRVPCTADIRYPLASGSKTFTALAAMRLVETGVLALDAPVRQWLRDDLPLVDDAVTLEHLLAHTSGIGDYLDEDAGWEVEDYVMTLPVHRLDTTEAFVPMLDGHAQRNAPGETYRYNNGGYMVIALVCERASGVPFHDLVDRDVFQRAGMASSGHLRLDSLPSDAAVGYMASEGDWSNVLHLPVRGNGDGGAFSTPDDIDRFWRAVRDGAVVSRESVAEMTRPRVDVPEEEMRYGMGFWLHASGPAWIIEGYDAGCSFRSTFDPVTGVTVSVMGNTSEGAWPVIGAMSEAMDVA